MITFADSIFLRKMRMAAPISDETASILASHLEECHFHKKELILREGIFCRYVWLLEKGFVRHYWVVNGEEATTSFSTEGTPIFSMDEMYYGKPSEEYAQAMEPVHAWRIKVGELEQLLRDNLELATWARIIHQNEYRRVHKSFKERLTLPARERYRIFTEEFPEVCRRANLGHIASYLGITLPTLSHIRSEERI